MTREHGEDPFDDDAAADALRWRQSILPLARERADRRAREVGLV